MKVPVVVQPLVRSEVVAWLEKLLAEPPLRLIAAGGGIESQRDMNGKERLGVEIAFDQLVVADKDRLRIVLDLLKQDAADNPSVVEKP